MEIDKSRMVQCLPLGLQLVENDPDRNRYLSLEFRQGRAKASDVGEITLMSRGDILFLYTDGVYDGSDKAERQRLESIMREHGLPPAERHVPCIARIRCQTRRSSFRAHPSGTDGSE